METFYRVNGWSEKPIKKVEVIRSTKEFVFREVLGKERQEKKRGEYFETWEEARDFLRAVSERNIEVRKALMQDEEQRLKEILALTKEGA